MNRQETNSRMTVANAAALDSSFYLEVCLSLQWR